MAVSIGDGLKEEKDTVKKSDGVDTLTPSQTKEKSSTTKTENPITQEEAVQIFQSALNYLMKAGFKVKGLNEDNQLILLVDNLQYETGRIFILKPEVPK